MVNFSVKTAVMKTDDFCQYIVCLLDTGMHQLWSVSVIQYLQENAKTSESLVLCT